jgi:hypothetical protein
MPTHTVKKALVALAAPPPLSTTSAQMVPVPLASSAWHDQPGRRGR